MKKIAGDIILHVYQKPIIWGTVPDKPENQNFEKMKLVQQKKQSYDVCVLDMEFNRHNLRTF